MKNLTLPKMTLSVAALIAANMVPLAGAIFLGWNAAMVVLLYWAENIVVGGYNVLKMATYMPAQPSGQLGKLFFIPFFCVHFGGFCAVHGLFVLILLGIGGGGGSPADAFPDHPSVGPLVFLDLLGNVVAKVCRNPLPGMEWAVLGLVVSHGVSFVQNYLLGGECRTSTYQKLMTQPYGRVVVLHLTIIAGAVPTMLLGSPVPLMCVLIGLKTIVDLVAHGRQHCRDLEPSAK